MRLKNKGCCDLEYAIELRKLGVKQESLWYWEEDPLDGAGQPRVYHKKDCFPEAFYYSAFTVAELGEILPYTISSLRTINHKQWVAEDMARNRFTEDTEANARAKMLIYLIKKGFVKV